MNNTKSTLVSNLKRIGLVFRKISGNFSTFGQRVSLQFHSALSVNAKSLKMMKSVTITNSRVFCWTWFKNLKIGKLIFFLVKYYENLTSSYYPLEWKRVGHAGNFPSLFSKTLAYQN